MKFFLWKVLPTFLPAILYYVLFEKTIPNWYWWENYGDPDLGYWFNGLLLLERHEVNHIDHPGTLVQMIAALIILGRSYFTGENSNIVDQFISDPVSHHLVYVYLVLSCFFMALTYCGVSLLNRKVSLPFVWLLQVLPIFVFDTIIYLAQITPESWLVIGYFLLLPVLWDICNSPYQTFHAIQLGTILGFLVSLKFHFLLTLFLIFQFKSWRAWAVALLCASFYFLMATAPIWNNYDRVFYWIYRLVFYKEGYGSGGAGMQGLTFFLANFLSLAKQTNALPFHCFLIFSPIFFVWAKKGMAWKDLAVHLLVLLLGFFLILKQAPVSRYLLVFLPFSALALLRLQECSNSYWKNTLVFVFLYSMISVLPSQVGTIYGFRSGLSNSNILARKSVDQVFENCVFITPLGNLLEFGLYAGISSLGKPYFTDQLIKKYPKFHSIFMKKVNQFGTEAQPNAEGLFTTPDFPCQIAIMPPGPIEDYLPLELRRNLVRLSYRYDNKVDFYGDRFHFSKP